MKKFILLLCIIMFFLVGTVSAFNFADGRIVFYSDLQNTTIFDNSGNGNNGVESGTVAVTGAGNGGNAINFSGSAYFTIANFTSQFTTDATMNIWIKFMETAGEPFEYGNASAADSWHNPSGTIYTDIFRDDRPAATGFSAIDTNWRMFTITQTPGANGYKIYENSSLIYQTAGESIVNIESDWMSNFGRSFSVGWLYFVGAFDELGIWNRTLSQIEITELYNSGTPLNFTGPSEPVVSLVSPTDVSDNLNGTISFNVTVTPDDEDLVNATVYIWYANTTIFKVQTNSTFDSQNASTLNINVKHIEEGYIWNVKGCEGDATGNNCAFASSNYTFNVKNAIIQNEQYNTPVLEQTSQTFRANFTTSEGFFISTANLIYNNTEYSGSFLEINSSWVQSTTTLTTPNIAADTNITFNWSITFTDASTITTTSKNQTVVSIGLDDCSVNTVQILNFTLVGEDSQNKINASAENSTINIDLDFYANSLKTTAVIEFSQTYSKTNPALVCLSDAIANSSYYMDVEVNYDAGGFAFEHYNIQSYELNATTGSAQNITLFDLYDNRSQEFTISYKDQSFLAVSDALVQVQRKYVSEGVFKTVEIPKTDINGEAPANLVLNDVVYSFTITKDGAVLGTFDNVYAGCQNPTVENCVIVLNSFSSSIAVTNFTYEKDFAYTLTYAEATRTVTTAFVIPSGGVSYVTLNVTKADVLGTSICNKGITTSAGSLSCTVANTFGNGTIYAQIYKDTELVAEGYVSTRQEPEEIYGASLVVIGLFLLLTVAGAAITDNPVFSILFFLVGVILLFALNLVDTTGFIGAGATILWLIVAIIIILIKIARRS